MNSNKSISILGCGWLGKSLAQKLLSRGFAIKGSTTTKDKIPELESLGIQAYHIDLNDAIQSIDTDFFHSSILVLNIPPGRRNPTAFGDYPARIEKALKLAKDQGVKHVIQISSTGVYESKTTSTDDPEWPVYNEEDASGFSDSAKVLLAGEQKLNTIFGENGTLIRFGGLVGGDRLAGRFLAGKTNVENGPAPVNMIHREDCIQIIAKIIELQKWGYHFNAVADEHPSRADFYIDQAKKYDFTPPTFVKSSSATGKIVDNQTLKQELNYTFSYADPMTF